LISQGSKKLPFFAVVTFEFEEVSIFARFFRVVIHFEQQEYHPLYILFLRHFMQSKGLVTTFVVLLTLACLLTYGSMWKTNSVEQDARDYAHQQIGSSSNKMTWNEHYARFIDSISTVKDWGIPYVKQFSYAELKKTQLGLGLDLKGGMSAVLQVELRDFLRSLSGNSTDPAFLAALDQATEAQKTEQTDYITLFANAWKNTGGGKSLASVFARNESLKTKNINFDSPDGAVESAIRELANGTVEETYKRLKQRIDKLGVVQPNVSLDAQRDLILVEMPGIDNPENARKFLQQSAKLEFWETYRMTDPGVAQGIVDADKRLKALQSGDTTTVAKKDSIMTYPLGANGLPDSTQPQIKVAAPETNQGVGPLLSILMLNASQEGVPPSPIVGYADKSNRKLISDMLARPEVKNLLPADLDFRWSIKPIEDDGSGTNTVVGKYYLYAIKKSRGSDTAPLDGSVVTGASAEPDPKGQIGVSLRMDNDGARTWSQLTKRAFEGGRREIAIALDDEIVSAPSVNGVIDGGTSSITGGFDLDEARDLSRILEVGKLPAGTRIVQESQVGPSLGQDNINASLLTMALSVLLLCGFMVAYYNKGGIVSVVALIANVFFIIGTLASLGTVLTLPGIAGIVLTLAAAVDANVIIYERIREEMRAGLDVVKAIGVGFSRALPAILDANMTTLLTALVLIYFGLGPIKGFGTVLLVGILCSLFTAVLLARLLTDKWVERGTTMSYSRPWSANVLANVNYDWIGKRKYAYMFSGAVILIGLVAFFQRGFELGVDFKGGYSFNIVFDQPVEGNTIRTALTPAFDGKTPIVKEVSANTYNVTTSYLVERSGAIEDVVAKLHSGLQSAGVNTDLAAFKNTSSTGTHIISSSQVGATVADDIRASSFKAAAWALSLIFLFLLIRFRRWQFSLGAVLALAHDVLLTLTFFTLLHGLVPFSLEIDQAIIACILTVIGYSVNDTVIVYDRIREFIKTFAGMPKEEVFNRAINTTLTRTLITSGTVFMVVLLLFLFGGAATKGFAFGMLVGMFFGTYSSIFVASALVVDLTSEKILSGKEVSAAPASDTAKTAKKEKA
jgi:SecD/SecF fusion protein